MSGAAHGGAHGGGHGDHGHGGEKGPEEKVVGFLGAVFALAAMVVLGLGINQAIKQHEFKAGVAQRAEREALVAKVAKVASPGGRVVETAAFLEVRPGKPRHYTFSAPDEVIAVRYLGEYPGYRDDEEEDAGVWVDFSGLGIWWKLDEPGPQDGISSPQRIETTVLFAGRKEGQTLTFSVLR